MKVLISLASVYHHWVVPSEEKLRLEYKVEYQLKNLGALLGNPFPTVESFLEAVRNPFTEVITREADQKIQNRSRCPDMQSLRALVSRYRSWPEFRNDETLNAIVDGFKNSRKMDMPIVLERNDFSRRVFSGNTRMDIAFMFGISPDVIILRVP
jgi:hypothetical protein